MSRPPMSWCVVVLLVGCGAGAPEPAVGSGAAEVVVTARAEALERWTGGDPCDFTQLPAASFAQVLACYHSVPWCPDPSNPATCDRDAQVAHFRQAMDGFSDLRETYQARYHWQERLEAISRAHFRGDYQQFLAFGELFAEFRSDHWAYAGPDCFELSLFELIPLNFGSMLAEVHPGRGKEQIIYLRQAVPLGGGAFDLSGYNALYQRLTGIDVSAFTGQRVLRLNGEEPLDFFRRWGRTSLRQDDDDGINLMSILDEAGYTLRSGSFNPFPESPTISLLLEDGAGKRTRLELPWIFIPLALVGFPIPVPASTAEFHAQCFAPSTPSGGSAVAASASFGSEPATRSLRGSVLREPMAYAYRVAQRRAWASAVPTVAGERRHGPRSVAEFAEVPDAQLGQDITEVYPLHDGARTVAYADETVAIQLRSDFISNWDQELDQGARYACDHARRLIVDVRGNGGGFVSRLQRAAHYLNPTRPALPDAVLAFRELSRSPELGELRGLSERLAALGFPPCYGGYEAACYLSMPSGAQVGDPSWYQREALERRGRGLEHLTPLVTFQPIVPAEGFVIPCTRFAGENLIVLLNGLNSSASFFFPELLRGVGTLVVQGGLQHQTMTTGRMRGGPTVYTSDWTFDQDVISELVGIPLEHRLLQLPRPVSFRLEHDAFYRPDFRTLYVDHPPTGDIQVAFWSNTFDSDGAAYRTAVSAVERRTVVDPVCGSAEHARHCREYRRCAERALDQAVGADRLSSTTAARTLEDAVAACQAD